MSIKKLNSLIAIAFLSLMSLKSFAQTDEDDDLLLSIPPLISGAINPTASFAPEWGIFADLCCPTSSATFSVTLNGETKRSVSPSCAVDSTFEGFSLSTPGNKNFSSTLSAANCPNFTSNFSLEFEEGLRYLIQAELQNGEPALALFIQEISVPSQKSETGGESISNIQFTKVQSVPIQLEPQSSGQSSYQSKD